MDELEEALSKVLAKEAERFEKTEKDKLLEEIRSLYEEEKHIRNRIDEIKSRLNEIEDKEY